MHDDLFIKYSILILLIYNFSIFFLYAMDKWKAKHHQYRISEATLLYGAVLGGAWGAWLGMYICHHKTQHRKFIILVNGCLVLQTLIVLSFYK